LATLFSPAEAAAQRTGIDVSPLQGEVDWPAVKGSEVRFAYVKATEGTDVQSPYFSQQYDGAYAAGVIRGAYHFALPDRGTGAEQADYFVDHGGDWSADDRTLPGVVAILDNPYGPTCYWRSPSQMVAWLHEFADEYQRRTSRDAVIYTTADWWNTCTGASTEFGQTNPLWVAQYGASEPTLPAGWDAYTFWQGTSSGVVPGILTFVNQSQFNGTAADLLRLANNSSQ